MDIAANETRILIIEDELELARYIELALSEAGYSVEIAHTLEEGRLALQSAAADLLLLDIMLPDGDGVAFLTEFRNKSATPVILVTARDGLSDRVNGLDAGADDYLVKPFPLEELLARIRAVLRRGRSGNEAVVMGDIRIDLINHRVTQAGRVVFLSSTEYSIVELLSRHHGEPVSKAAILKHVWDDESRPANIVEVYINSLRHKFERAGAPRVIHTIRNRGYVFGIDQAE